MFREFATNTWYVAAWAVEVGCQLQGHNLLAEPVVHCREQDDTMAAISGIYPHRLAPLAKG